MDVKIESEKGISVLLGVVCFDGDCLIVEERSKMFDAAFPLTAFLSLTHSLTHSLLPCFTLIIFDLRSR